MKGIRNLLRLGKPLLKYGYCEALVRGPKSKTASEAWQRPGTLAWATWRSPVAEAHCAGGFAAGASRPPNVRSSASVIPAPAFAGAASIGNPSASVAQAFSTVSAGTTLLISLISASAAGGRTRSPRYATAARSSMSKASTCSSTRRPASSSS